MLNTLVSKGCGGFVTGSKEDDSSAEVSGSSHLSGTKSVWKVQRVVKGTLISCKSLPYPLQAMMTLEGRLYLLASNLSLTEFLLDLKINIHAQ